MKIDWKKLSETEGYKSLKAAYTHDLKRQAGQARPMRDKEELYRHFQWVICRAKHYAIWLGIPIEDVLAIWESKRKYWWLNYYQDCNQPKGHRNNLKPIGKKGIKKRKKLRGY